METIDLSASYFVPDEMTLQAPVDALKRGVVVRIIVPGEYIDTEVVRKASRASWGPLLAAGAEIREFSPTKFYCKMLIVDGLLVSVGSTNIDERSFRLNDEANLNIYDAGFAEPVTRVFNADLQRARKITYEQWKARPIHEKLMERAASLLSSQLWSHIGRCCADVLSECSALPTDATSTGLVERSRGGNFYCVRYRATQRSARTSS